MRHRPLCVPAYDGPAKHCGYPDAQQCSDLVGGIALGKPKLLRHEPKDLGATLQAFAAILRLARGHQARGWDATFKLL